MHIEKVATQFGDFVLETTHLGLAAVHLPGSKTVQCETHNDGSAKQVSPSQKGESHAAPLYARTAKDELLAYLRGDLAVFVTPIDYTGTSQFLRDVLFTLRSVPLGLTVSYKDLARLSGYSGAIRAVGGAMKRNRTPIFVPCHRVIAAGNKLGGWSGPAGWKEKLLIHEGVVLST